jgi:hypothetical protein
MTGSVKPASLPERGTLALGSLPPRRWPSGLPWLLTQALPDETKRYDNDVNQRWLTAEVEDSRADDSRADDSRADEETT